MNAQLNAPVTVCPWECSMHVGAYLSCVRVSTPMSIEPFFHTNADIFFFTASNMEIIKTVDPNLWKEANKT